MQFKTCIFYYILPIGIFSGTDMIKIWNWFKAIGSFVRKIKEKKHKCRIVRVPKCLTQVPNCPSAEMSYTGAEVSSIRSTFPVAVSDCIPFLVVP
jgi:polyphosphate kinase